VIRRVTFWGDEGEVTQVSRWRVLVAMILAVVGVGLPYLAFGTTIQLATAAFMGGFLVVLIAIVFAQEDGAQ
jgi:hypothetical protein